MICPACGKDANAGAKFCDGCGIRLQPVCGGCGSENSVGARFCIQCGHELTLGAASPLIAGAETGAENVRTHEVAPEGSRKLVTILFADVVGFTSMSERLDAEEADDIMRPCFELMQEAVHRYGGIVSQFLGDGIMALFGAPLAQEDHAERGVLAALSIQKALRDFEREVMKQRGISVRMRIGLNSGNVVVGTIGTDINPTYTAIGDAVNLASRIEGLAPIGSVAISENTERLVSGSFDTRDMGAHSVKGKEVPVGVHEVLRAIGRGSRARSQTPLVGRKQPLESMLARYEAARAGSGQVILLSGEPGIGKSRLLEEFIRRIEATEPAFMTGQCVSYGQNTPYLPVLDLLRKCFALEDSDSDDTILKKVGEYTQKFDGDLSDEMVWLKFLLSVDPGDGSIRKLDSSIRKARVFEGLRSFVIAHARTRPVVVVFEDLHWMDEVSLEFISFLLAVVAEAPIMVVLTHRPEFKQPFGAPQHLMTISLSNLAGEESAELVATLLGTGSLPAELTALVTAKTEGNPFFVEQVVRSMLESGTIRREGTDYALVEGGDDDFIPATVQDIIAARLDRLDAGSLEVIRTAAFIGMEFSAHTLATACGTEVRTSEAVLTLKQAELISEKSLFPELTYSFHHSLTRDVVVESLLKPKRRSLHLSVARAIEQTYADRQLDQVEVLAHHYEEAEAWPEAVDFLLKSGRKALAAAAPALAFYRRGLAVSEKEPEAIVPTAMVSLHRGMGLSLQLSGQDSLAVDSFGASLRSASAAGDKTGQGRALLDLVSACIWAHRFEEAQQWAEIARNAAVEAKSNALLAGSHYAVAFMNGLTGRMVEGRVAADEAMEASLRPGGEALNIGAPMVRGLFHHWDGEAALANEYFDEMLRNSRKPEGTSSLTAALFFKAMAACAEGNYMVALAALNEGLELATRLNDKPRLSRLRNTLGWLRHDLCDIDGAIQENTESLVFASEVGDPETISFGHLNLSDCYLELGRLDEAEAHLEPVIQESERDAALGDKWMRWRYTQHLYVNQGWLALRRGRADEALRRADDCIEAATESGTPRYVGKGLRLRGVTHTGERRFDEAAEALSLSLDATRQVGNPYQIWRTLAALSDLERERGNDDEAISHAAEALAVVDDVAAGLDDGALRDGLLTSSIVADLRSRAGG